MGGGGCAQSVAQRENSEDKCGRITARPCLLVRLLQLPMGEAQLGHRRPYPVRGTGVRGPTRLAPLPCPMPGGWGACSDPAPPSLPAPSLGLPRPGPASRGSCRARHLRPTCWLSHRAGRCHSRDLAPRPRRKSEGRSLGDKGDATAPAFGTREGSRPTTASAAVSLSRAHVINSHRFAKPCVRAVPRRFPVTRRCRGAARQPEAAAGHGVVRRGRRGPWPPTRQLARRSAEPPGAHGAEGKCGIARVD